MSQIEKAVADRILRRSKAGLRKYGVSMERTDLTLIEWLQHLQEEMMDACVYLEKIKQEINYTDEIDPEMEVYGVRRGPCVAHDKFSEEEEERERRMNIIGRNGNDGLHYDKTNWRNKINIQKFQQDQKAYYEKIQKEKRTGQ